jgi:signal transduction histidine kinase
MLGRNVSMLMPEPDRSRHDHYIENYQRPGQAKIIGIGREVQAVRKDGTVFPIDLAVGESRVGEQHFYTGLVKDISKRKATERALRESEEALRQARDQLLAANNELERKVQERTARLQETIGDLEHFSYSITHDMRAPLRAMQGFAALVLEELGASLPPLHKDYLHRIVTASERLDNLIRDALNFGQAARQEPELKPVNTDALLKDILASYPAFPPPKAKIHIEEKMPPALGNEAAMTQCFSNLLNNAVKFVQPGKIPEVRIWAEVRQDFVRYWFADNGIGIPMEQQERIFEMFQRLSDRYEGTGIGLALVRKLVTRMKGRVGVESEPGTGSRFWIELKRIHQLAPC